MKFSTVYTYTFLLVFVCLLLPARQANAQIFEPGVCSYEDDCIFVEFTSIQEESPTSPTLLVVLTAFLSDQSGCADIDGLLFTPVGGFPVRRSRAQLAANPFVEFTVNRNLFVNTPDVLVATYENFLIPIINVNIPIPTDIIDLQARLDSDNPCLPITPLPVELVSFSGRTTPSGVSLEWRTASEENNSHFEVERSADGKQYAQIGTVQGNGSTSVAIDYTFSDPEPVQGVNYYRLKQVDYDGQYEYSKTIAVAAAAGTMSMKVELAPNPCAGNDCTILVSNPGGANSTKLQLKDLSGKVVYSTTLSHSGNGLIEVPLQELGRYKGLFILSAVSGDKVVHQRVVLE
ncbi:MAG: T9SS type A sorting domain-containing protein [Hymenobacteraceae bacterium]|nr:T9SS type A sorting domain-containing protein [Hymenobacteraceae bacterium]